MVYSYQYPRPAVTTDAIVLRKSEATFQVLLIERKHDPYKGKWALPGGFVEMDEELENACARELIEETGISDVLLHQFSTFGTVGRDPRGRTISIVFWGMVTEEQTPIAGDDAEQAKWFPIMDLPNMAFDHQKIMEMFIRTKRTLL